MQRDTQHMTRNATHLRAELVKVHQSSQGILLAADLHLCGQCGCQNNLSCRVQQSHSPDSSSASNWLGVIMYALIEGKAQ